MSVLQLAKVGDELAMAQWMRRCSDAPYRNDYNGYRHCYNSLKKLTNFLSRLLQLIQITKCVR
jgi:hypothetical protein